jgi:glycosyltransferase involved in cell wall biosynthesis
MKPRAQAKSSAGKARIAWLLPSMKGGFYWQPLFREFTSLFPKTLILTGCWPGFLPGLEDVLRVRQLRGIRFVTLEQRGEGYSSGFTWASPSILWHLIRFRPRVIFVIGFNFWTLYVLALKALMGWRVILLWEGISPTIAYLDAPFRLTARRMMARNFDATITNTQEAMDYLRDVIRIPISKLLRHPYEVAELSTMRSGRNVRNSNKVDSSLKFLYVGQLIRRKGIHLLLRACELLVQRGLDSFSVAVVGEGEEGEELRKESARLGLEARVHWVGAINYRDLGVCYQDCDAFVLPTLEDTWALVVLEAMVAGKPVLCSKFAGAKELVHHGVNGYLFDPGNPAELADCMEHLVREPRLLAQFGQRSKEIIAPFTPQRAAEVLATCINYVLKPTKGNGFLSRQP